MDDPNERIAVLRNALKPRQRDFADLILQEIGPTEAYRTVYDTDPENPLKATSCRECGSRLLGHPKVRAYVEAVTAQAIDEIIINRAEVIAGLRDVAMSGIIQGPGAGARVTALSKLLDILTPGGSKQTVVHTGPDGKPIQTETTHRGGLSPDFAADVAKRLFGLPDAKTEG